MDGHGINPGNGTNTMNKDKKQVLENQLLEKYSELTLSDNDEFAIQNDRFCKLIKVKQANEKGNKIEKTIYEPIANCVFKLISNITNGSRESKRIIYIKHNAGKEYWQEFNTSELKLDSFDTRLKSIGCTFLGTANEFKRLISMLMDIEITLHEISYIGHNPEHDIFALSNCIITYDGKIHFPNELGICEIEDKKYYLPAVSSTNKNDIGFDFIRKYSFQDAKIDFKKWAELIYISSGVKGSIGILYMILALFWDIVYYHFQHFPFLFLFGQYSTGKTSFVKHFLKLFGKNIDGTSLTSTTAGINRTVSLLSNGINYLKEYTSETDKEHKEFLLSAYDGIGRTTGASTNDLKTNVQIIRSALILDGNEHPSENGAVISRFIALTFKKLPFTEKEKEAFRELASFESFSPVLIELLKCRKLFSSSFREIFGKIDKEIEDLSLDTRIREHVALILTPFRILNHQLKFPFTWEEVKKEIIDYAMEQQSVMSENKETTIFWKAFERYQDELLNIKPPAFKWQYPDEIINSNTGIIYLRFEPCYQYYIRYCRDNQIRPVNKSTLRKFLIETKSFDKPNQGSRQGHTRIVDGLGSSYGFMFYGISGSEIKIDDVTIILNDWKK